MKYWCFAMAVLGIFPLAAFCSVSRRYLGWLVGLMFLPVLVFDATALNFISYEFYRGTSCGMEVSLAYVIALGVLVSMLLRGARVSLIPDFGTMLFLAYFVWCLVSALANDGVLTVRNVSVGMNVLEEFQLHGRMLSFFELWKMAMLLLVFAAVYGFLAHVNDERPVFRALAWVVLASSLFVVCEHFAGVFQVRGPFPHQNSLAMFMMLVGPVFFAGYLCLPWSRYQRLCAVAFVCASAVLVRTYSRGALVCYPFALLAVAGIVCLRRFRVVALRRLMPVAVIGMIGLLLLSPRIVQRFLQAPESSATTRKYLARVALSVACERPLVGVGPNNWSAYVTENGEFAKVIGEKMGQPVRTRQLIGVVETVYLLTLAECGLVGMCLMILWLLYYWFSAWRLSRRLAGTDLFYLSAGLFGGLSGCLLQSCLEWVLRQQLNFMLLMVCFATLSWLNRRRLAICCESPSLDEKEVEK